MGHSTLGSILGPLLFMQACLFQDVPTAYLKRSSRRLRDEDLTLRSCTFSWELANDLVVLKRGGEYIYQYEGGICIYVYIFV